MLLVDSESVKEEKQAEEKHVMMAAGQSELVRG
jgi:hypothetical protein